MKNTINISVKSLGLAAILIGCSAILANAQTGKRAASNVISKDVHRVANKRAYNDETAAPHVVVISDGSAWVQAQSKGVQSKNRTKAEGANEVASTGTPQWVVSKPVQRKETESSELEQPAPKKTDSIVTVD